MIRRLTLSLFSTLLLPASFAVAQTYTGQPNFVCTGNASRYPITSFAQFQCNTDNLSLNGVQAGALWFRGNASWTQVQFNGQLAETGTLVLDQFTSGTLAYHATVCDTVNPCRSVSVSATWKDVVSRSGWHYPQLVTNTVTVQ
jgi:hypothetical protein